MALEDAIKHCYEVSALKEKCDQCGNEHLQLAHWLEELLECRKQNIFP